MKPVKKLLVYFILLTAFLNLSKSAFASQNYSFIVAGHSYGSPHQDNLGTYPKFLNQLKANLAPHTQFIILNGDIIRDLKKPESWQHVEDDLKTLGIDYYFVMGNHDYSEEARKLFTQKFGNTYYQFKYNGELFIILDSQTSYLAITKDQLDFLSQTLSQTKASTIFIFFHDLLWLGNNPEYAGIKSNTTSRFENPLTIRSNYWSKIEPILQQYPEKNIYLIGGDLGGQADSIPAFFQKRDNITFIATGMGAIREENYLLVQVSKGEAKFSLIPLNSQIKLKPLEFYTPQNLKFEENKLAVKAKAIVKGLLQIIKTRNFRLGLIIGRLL